MEFQNKTIRETLANGYTDSEIDTLLSQKANPDIVIKFVKNMQVDTNWRDLTKGEEIISNSGLYLIQVYLSPNDDGYLGIWSGRACGVLSWEASDTNGSNNTFEIPLSYSAHTFNGNKIKLRTLLSPNINSGGDGRCHLQIASDVRSSNGNIHVEVYLRKMI